MYTALTAKMARNCFETKCNTNGADRAFDMLYSDDLNITNDMNATDDMDNDNVVEETNCADIPIVSVNAGSATFRNCPTFSIGMNGEIITDGTD